jgi:LysR family hydrogen peroxide-inducible transcriptional activator
MDLSALTIQQLRYVIAVERHRSFRDAALASHVSQPALSMQIKKLEDLLDVCVFDRSKQPIIVTEKGSRVVAQAKLALEHFERIGSVVGRQEELSGTFRLGIIPTLLPTLVPRFLSPFARAHPRIDLEIVEAKTTALLRGLREGSIDGGLAATPLEVAGIHERVICHERFFGYLPEGHTLLSRGRLHQADLMDEQVWLLGEGHCFRTQVLHLCSADRRHDGGKSSVQCECGSFETLIGIVDSGFGVTILPELVVRSLPAARQAAQVRPFAVPEPVREISFLHAREQERVEVADALVHTLSSVMPPDLIGRKPRRSSILKPGTPSRK